MHPYARLRPGTGFEPLKAALYYAQRLATTPPVREAVARSIGFVVNRLHDDPSLYRSLSPIEQPLQTLERDGLARLDPVFSSKEVDLLVARLKREPLVGPEGKRVSLEDARIQCSMAAYPLSTLLDCQAVRDFANSPAILTIARNYLGCTPTISSIGVRWSFPKPSRLDTTQAFHRDVDDWRFMKAFMYLTDVDRESGPHRYVKRTHRTPSRLRALPYSAAELEQEYGAKAIETVVGPRGTTFIADTFGIHCGMPPLTRPRLILQVQYSILPIYAFRYDPLKLPISTGENRYINRLLMQ